MLFPSLLPVLVLAITAYASVQAGDKYVVEMEMVVDQQAQKNYQLSGVKEKDVVKQIVYDLISMTDQINGFFKTLSASDVNIEIRLSNFNMSGKGVNIISPGKVNRDTALSEFQDYLQNMPMLVEGYDVKILLTGHDLVAGKDSMSTPVAVSTDSNVCQKSSSGVSVIEFTGWQETAQRVAREIAKILGAKVQDSPDCAGYLMSSDKFAKNRWSFSKCTAGAIKDFIKNKECLKTISFEHEKTLKNLNIPENHDNLNHQAVCKRTLRSSKAYFCGQEKFFGGKRPHGDVVCQAIYCSHYKKPEKCMKVIPPEGMVCDVKKRCSKGKCVASTIKTNVKNSDCVFGNVFSSRTCAAQLKWNPQLCYNNTIYDTCCGQCERQVSGGEDCKWGDRINCCKETKNTIEACTVRKRDCCAFCTHMQCLSKK